VEIYNVLDIDLRTEAYMY